MLITGLPVLIIKMAVFISTKVTNADQQRLF
jgi:hypothetical protein